MHGDEDAHLGPSGPRELPVPSVTAAARALSTGAKGELPDDSACPGLWCDACRVCSSMACSSASMGVLSSVSVPLGRCSSRGSLGRGLGALGSEAEVVLPREGFVDSETVPRFMNGRGKRTLGQRL